MNNKKTIFFLINNLGYGGAERVFVDDANSLFGEGYDVRFVILYGGSENSPLAKELKIPNNNIHFLDSSHMYDLLALRKLRKILKNIGECTLYTTLHDAIFFSRLASLGNKKVFLAVREANTLDSKSLLHKFYDLLFNFRVNKFIAVSNEVRDSMVQYQPWLRNKVSLLYNGVEIPAKGEYMVNGDLLAIGSLTPKKAYNVMLEAFSGVVTQYPSIHLNIVGDGILKSELQKIVSSKNIGKNVTFLGNLSVPDRNNLYKASSIFVLSSRQEGCPNVILEAMSYGLPCVATGAGAVPELISDGITGYVVPIGNSDIFAEKIIKLLEDRDLAKTMGEASYEKAKQEFSRENHLKDLKKIIFA